MSAFLPVASGDELALSSYLAKVNKIPLLADDEETNLAIEVQERQCIKSAQQMVLSHLRLVVKIAYKYKNYGITLLDLIAEGNIGLMHAVKRFRHDMGCRLSTYAVWWIRAAMQDFILKSWSLLKIPLNSALKRKLFYSLNKERRRIEDIDSKIRDEATSDVYKEEKNLKHGNPLRSDQELSDGDNGLANCHDAVEPGSDMPTLQQHNSQSNDIMSADALKNSRYLLAMDHAMNNSENTQTLGETIQDETEKTQENMLIDKQEAQRRKLILAQAIKTLNQREKEIIAERRLATSPTTLASLAQRYGISTERVRQIEERAIDKLSKVAITYADVKL